MSSRRCRALAALVLTGLLAGCRTAPAHFTAYGPDRDPPSRPAAIVHQIAKDTAVETATHPVRATATLVTNAADTTWSIAEGLVGKRLLLPLCGTPDPLPEERPVLDRVALEADLRRQTGRDLRPAHVELQRDGAQALAVLERLIDAAADRLDVMMFLWEGDEVGRSLAERLAARARQGVAVRVLVDGSGNLIYGKPAEATSAEVNSAVTWLASQPGVTLLRTRDGFARFDHRKLIVADGCTAWSGGRNFNRSSFFTYRDVCFTVTGPLVDELQEEFERAWQMQGGERQASGGRQPPEAPSQGADAPRSPDAPRSANAHARLVCTGPLRHDFRDTIFTVLDRACHHIYLENPYLCDCRVVVRLAKARRRGVDVRVVMTLDTTTPIFGESNKVTANRLLEAGVRVYLRPGMTHVKALAVDGLWAYLGNGNFDALSLRSDCEVGLAIGAGALVRQVEDEILIPEFRPEWELHEPLPLTLGDRFSELFASLLL